jgi:hypothetical protein
LTQFCDLVNGVHYMVAAANPHSANINASGSADRETLWLSWESERPSWAGG